MRNNHINEEQSILSESTESITVDFSKKLGPEEKVKQEKIIPFLRDVLGYKLMDFEVPVRFGRMTKFADIVVSIIDSQKKIPYIVVECKAPQKIHDDDWLQAESYAQRLGAKYFVITDGSKFGWRWYKTGDRQGESTIVKTVANIHIDIKKEGDALIKFEDLNSLSRVMQQCHDIIRNEEGADPAKSFDEIGKLLFAKMRDERDVCDKRKKNREFFINGSKDTPSSVAVRVKDLFKKAKSDFPLIYSEVLESKIPQVAVNISLKDKTIYQIVGIIEPYTFTETGLDKHGVDIKGAMFEIFLKGTFRGQLGQYFTPRQIIDFMVGVVNPIDNESVIDPACGSGGFLIGAMKKVWHDQHERYISGGIDNLDTVKRRYAQKNLFGLEINDRLAWVAKMNMVFHGDGHGGLIQTNALEINTRNKEIMNRSFEVILTNPPFGAKVSDPEILSDDRYKEVSNTKSTEIFFLALCIKLLAPGGRLGIVLPEGVLTNSSSKSVRDLIKRETIVKAVVSLPTETFIPFGTGVKTSLIFLQKKDPQNPYSIQDKVFMAIAKNIGYDSTGRETNKNDLDKILDEYHKFEEKYYGEQ